MVKDIEFNEMRNITRFDQKPRPGRGSGTHGWWVRFRLGKKRFTQLFSDNKFNGKEKALKAAKTYRDAIEREVRPKQTNTNINVRTRRNRTGIVGVNRSKSTSKKNGKSYTKHVWQAHWPKPNGKLGHKAFTVEKYGEEEALKLAIEARISGLAHLTEKLSPVFKSPKDTSIKVWRYMDFTKFISILEHKSLYFPLVIELNDPFEGSFSRGNEQFRPLVYKHIKPKIDIGGLIRKLRSWVAVSCWHMNNHESAAMWNLYSKTEEAICIQSTYRSLKRTLGNEVDIGIVQYVDYDKDWIPEDHPLLPFLYKRKSFSHESEIRAIVNLSHVESLDVDDITADPPTEGIFKEVNLGEFINNIYVAPYSAPWFYNLVKEVSATYGLGNINIVQSSLENEPFF